MTNGVFIELEELTQLQRYAQRLAHRSKSIAKASGNHLSKVRGRGMDFSETRHYQAGDEIRHMEWRVTARTGRPHVKLYEEAKERPVIILVDFNPSMVFGTRTAFKSVIAARLAAVLAWTTVSLGDKVGGFFFSSCEHNEFPPKGRQRAVFPLLASLSHYTKLAYEERNKPPRPLSDALNRLHRVIRPGSILILISDFYALDNDAEKHLLRLRAHNDLLAYQICDPLELCPPKSGLYPITDGQKEMLLDTNNPSINQAYMHWCEQKKQSLKAYFHHLHIQYEQVTATSSLSQLVTGFRLRRPRG